MVLSARELQAACFELEVFVGNRAVGIIERRAEQFSFQYYPKVDQADFVSLLMPVRNQPYFALQAGRLPPVFDMNLPEGSLRRMLETRYSKVVSGFNDLALLALVGRNTLGRLGFGVPRAQDAPKLTLGALVNCADDDALLAQLYAGDAFFSGVAGVQPKALASVDDGAIEKFSDASAPGQDLKATFRGERLIIKAGGAHTPWIAANEFYCLRAAHLSGLVVPPIRLLKGGQVLLVERFDCANGSLNPQEPLGAEDFCALSGKVSDQRYDGTYERAAKTLASFVDLSAQHQDLLHFFTLVVLSCVVHNGDAHLKNFMLLYDASSEDPRVGTAMLTYWEHGRAHGLGRAIKGEGDGRN